MPRSAGGGTDGSERPAVNLGWPSHAISSGIRSLDVARRFAGSARRTTGLHSLLPATSPEAIAPRVNEAMGARHPQPLKTPARTKAPPQRWSSPPGLGSPNRWPAAWRNIPAADQKVAIPAYCPGDRVGSSGSGRDHCVSTAQLAPGSKPRREAFAGPIQREAYDLCNDGPEDEDLHVRERDIKGRNFRLI
jgi:hypothetical protein